MANVYDFVADDDWQRGMRDKLLKPYFYEQKYQGRYEFLHHTDPRAVGGVDTLIMDTIKIDEKIVRPRHKNPDDPYTAYALETRSCTRPGRESVGWMWTNIVHWLLYCFSNKLHTALTCHAIRFPELKRWFWPTLKDNPDKWPAWFDEEHELRPICRIVPFRDVERVTEVKIFHVQLEALPRPF